MSEPATLEPPAKPAAVGTPPSLADLILLRLLVAKDGKSVKELQKELEPLVRHTLHREQIETAIISLRNEGFLLGSRGQKASDAGRARALQFLGIDALPARSSWQSIKGNYLLPTVLGLDRADSEFQKAARTGESLAAYLLKRRLKLSSPVRNTLSALIEALICRELGHPEFTRLHELEATLLGRVVDGDPIKRAEAKTVLPRVLLGAKKLELGAIAAAMISGRMQTESDSAGQPTFMSSNQLEQPVENGVPPAQHVLEEPFDLETFANTVTSTARTCRTGRFAEDKVFINHVWKQLQEEPRFDVMGFDGFKNYLLLANREHRLTLGRADLPELMHPEDVRESEIRYLTAAFHFILLGKD